MPFTVSCTPAPLTFTIRPRFDWQFLLSIAWVVFIGYELLAGGWSRIRSADVFDIVIVASVSMAILLSLIRRERIEIYPDRVVWSKTYFGITRAKVSPLADVLGAEWNEGEQQGRQSTPSHVEFYLPTASVKACYGFTFDEFEKMRQDIGTMYPNLIKRWGRATVRSKDLTLLNLS